MNRARLLEHIAEQIGITPELITPEKRLVEDLGLDSLDLIELTMNIEDEIATEFPWEEIESIKTVQELIEFVGKKAGVPL